MTRDLAFFYVVCVAGACAHVGERDESLMDALVSRGFMPARIIGTGFSSCDEKGKSVAPGSALRCKLPFETFERHLENATETTAEPTTPRFRMSWARGSAFSWDIVQFTIDADGTLSSTMDARRWSNRALLADLKRLEAAGLAPGRCPDGELNWSPPQQGIAEGERR
ncbi:MAG: hypothetical protein QM765_20410 [Myxococcales bacterium]